MCVRCMYIHMYLQMSNFYIVTLFTGAAAFSSEEKGKQFSVTNDCGSAQTMGNYLHVHLLSRDNKNHLCSDNKKTFSKDSSLNLLCHFVRFSCLQLFFFIFI